MSTVCVERAGFRAPSQPLTWDLVPALQNEVNNHKVLVCRSEQDTHRGVILGILKT